jgi:hypothetical protein
MSEEDKKHGKKHDDKKGAKGKTVRPSPLLIGGCMSSCSDQRFFGTS